MQENYTLHRQQQTGDPGAMNTTCYTTVLLFLHYILPQLQGDLSTNICQMNICKSLCLLSKQLRLHALSHSKSGVALVNVSILANSSWKSGHLKCARGNSHTCWLLRTQSHLNRQLQIVWIISVRFAPDVHQKNFTVKHIKYVYTERSVMCFAILVPICWSVLYICYSCETLRVDSHTNITKGHYWLV